MAFLKKKKIKKKHLKNIGLASLIVVSNLVTFCAMQYKLNSQIVIYEANALNTDLENSSLNKTVLVPIRDIEKNTEISESDFEKITLKTDMNIDVFAGHQDIEENKFSVVDLKMGQPVNKSVLYSFELTDTDRIEEFNMFLLQSDLKASDYIDVRIFYPNGENYIVLDKKKIIDLDLENNNIWLQLDEKEIHYISSAIIDSYITGSKIYVNKYVQPSVQEDAIPTYLPSEEVLKLIDNNPNILFEIRDGIDFELIKTKRKALDLRMEAMEEEDLQKVEENVQKEDDEKAELISENIENELAENSLIDETEKINNVESAENKEVEN